MSAHGPRKPREAETTSAPATGLLTKLKAVPSATNEDGFFSSLYLFDRAFGLRPLAGLDEAGRGPLAGPLVAACVILPEDFDHKLIDDSKKLKAETLKQAFDLITSKAINWSYALRTPKEVDELNPLWASMSAMGELLESFQPRPALALVDGNKLPISQVKLKAVVHGDAKSLSIAAASIIAKVIRDQLMDEEHARYPQYGFNKHKGYGTKEHLETLARYGPSPIHRLTFRHVRPNETGPVGPRLF